MFASLMAGGFSSPNTIRLSYGAPPKNKYAEIPHCAKNTTKAWCLEDSEYPQHEVQQALEKHYQPVLALYKDKLASTENSVNGLDKFNDEGKWQIIVNRIESYGVKYTQTARIEECNVVVGTSCPLVPSCYESKCIQKNVIHRFLVYNPYDYTFPFAIEKFKLPGSCGCVVGAFHL
ncbi:hypothetical protein GHT06_021293 [Daphnia sinensis]|uniref:Spaetzle domain-containing protein n=1 Tax=Daphnia sinensis TaxID=1820382 RepID=A0AAD5KIU2_9CRUS|nr:hypothetical protein GHT06_021293 [Daphnia sinensis]